MSQLLWLLSYIAITSASQQCKDAAYSQRGNYLKGHVISSGSAAHISDCLVKCSDEPRCKSINFRFKELFCELNDADRYTHPKDYGSASIWHAYSDYPQVVHPWLAFWWWKANGTWPAKERDVLAFPYGYCSSYSVYCFGRIPTWALEDSTEMLAVDSVGNEYMWKFDSHNAVAHAAWLAFHDHVTTTAGEVLNSPDSWDPVVLKGTQPKAKQDSFMYREQNGVKSILMDDDNCDCLSTLNIGHGLCNTGHSTSYGPANRFGVDALYDSHCNAPRPEVGLTLYFRVK